MNIVNSLPPAGCSGLVAIDVETFGQAEGKVHRPTGTFACVSICSQDEPETVYQLYDQKQVAPALKALSKATWVFHNALYDLTQLRRFAKIPPRFIWDTMLVEKSMYGGYFSGFSLADLSRRILGVLMEKEVRKDFTTLTEMTADMKKYAAVDAWRTLQIAIAQQEYKESPAFNAYKLIDEKSIFPVLDMGGILVDKESWMAEISKFQEIAERLQEELGFNVKSPVQVMAALKKEKIHLKSTGQKILAAFSHNETVAKILEARLYRDAVSKYGMKWLEESVEADGRVYCSYNIDGAETGRMSANNPNMQNIPARKLPVFRTFFVAAPGKIMVVTDVSQQEPRILAYESKDEEYLKIFRNGLDSHLEVARVIFHEPNMEKSDPRRKNEGKMVNLGTSYGMSARGLSDRLNISEEEAERFLTAYFGRFRGVFSWISQMRSVAMSKGFVTTASGRRIYVNQYNKQWMNNAINAPIQGGAADFTKMWLRKIWEKCHAAKIDYPVVALIHDEIVSEVSRAQLKVFTKILNESFQETAATLYSGVPFVTETEFGKSWGCKNSKDELVEIDLEEEE